MIPSIMSGSLIRDTPPWARMSAGTRSSAITATAPASSAIFACSGVTTSMITPPLSISASPRFTGNAPVRRPDDWGDVACSLIPPSYRSELAVLWWDRYLSGLERDEVLGIVREFDPRPARWQGDDRV